MKAVLDLTKSITDKGFYASQFVGAGTEKNILFVSPQLTSKHLYKFILPFFSFYTEEIHPAITSLSKFDPYKQIVTLDTTLTQTEIIWANFIVFPFTTHDLSKQYGLYEAIREVNPMAKIVFCVDFNYYEIPQEHPYRELFEHNIIKEQVERNILKADLVLVNNIHLHGFLLQKFQEFIKDKYLNVSTKVTFGCVPYLIDEQVVLQNIDFESYKPEPVINKEIFKKVNEIAENIKKEDLKNNEEKAIRVNSRKTTPKKATTKTKKVNGKKSKKAEPVKRGRKSKEEEPIIEQAIPENKESEVPIIAPVVPEPPKIELPKKYRIGIICSPTNYGDIKDFNEQFQQINDKFGEQVSLIFIGYDYEEDKQKILDGVNFEYVKQISIIHYFKQLRSLELDMVVIPVQKNNFNITSENINKYLECSLLKIPLFVHDMYPYNAIIVDKRNGFLHKEKENFIEDLEHILKNPDLIKVVGEQSKKDCTENYTYTVNNIKIMSDVYEL